MLQTWIIFDATEKNIAYKNKYYQKAVIPMSFFKGQNWLQSNVNMLGTTAHCLLKKKKE